MKPSEEKKDTLFKWLYCHYCFNELEKQIEETDPLKQ